MPTYNEGMYCNYLKVSKPDIYDSVKCIFSPDHFTISRKYKMFFGRYRCKSNIYAVNFMCMF